MICAKIEEEAELEEEEKQALFTKKWVSKSQGIDILIQKHTTY